MWLASSIDTTSSNHAFDGVLQRGRHTQLHPEGKRMSLTTSQTELACVYQKETPEGKATQSAHPGTSPELVAPLLTSLSAARFSPDDSFSRQRVQLKKRFNLLPTQQENIEY